MSSSLSYHDLDQYFIFYDDIYQLYQYLFIWLKVEQVKSETISFGHDFQTKKCHFNNKYSLVNFLGDGVGKLRWIMIRINI